MPSRIVAIKYFGGKNKGQMPDLIQRLLEPNDVYVEPFCGSAGIFFNKPPSQLEVINDIDSNVVTFFRCLRNDHDKLIESLRRTPFAREEYESCRDRLLSGEDMEDMERARCWYVSISMAHAARFGSGFAVQRMTPDRRSGVCQSFGNRVDKQLPRAVERLRGCVIENIDAIELIHAHNREDTSIYCDPPYPAQTLNVSSAYPHDTSTLLHERLLNACLESRAQVVISTYDNDLYQTKLKDWHRFEIEVTAHSSAAGDGTIPRRRMEVAYANRVPSQMPLF